MRKKIITFISIILIALLFSSVAIVATKNTSDGRCGMTQSQILEAANHWYDVDSEQHMHIDYNDIEYTGIDTDAYYNLANKFKSDFAQLNNEDEVIADYNKLLDLYKDISTQYAVTEINYNRDVTNEENSELKRICEEQVIEIEDTAYSLLRDVLLSEYKDTISELIGNDEAVEDLIDYEEMTPRQKELDVLINDLKIEYYSVMQKDEYEYNGVTYSLSELDNLYDEDKISYEEYCEGYDGFTKGANKEASEIYISLVELLNEYAMSYDYDNYAEFGYDKYNRDYTTEDIKSVYSDVQKYIVPLSKKINERAEYNEELYQLNLNEEEKLNKVEPIIKEIDPGLLMAWDYLRRYHMYDMNQRDTKADTGFTTSLMSYGGAYIFDSPYGYYEDVYTVVHEFGHYNNFFHQNENPFLGSNTLDVAEINSQALELLSFEHSDKLFGKENAYDAQIYKLSSIMHSIISGCIFDEFQVAVFEYEGELTTETLNTLFHDISAKYGYEYEEGETQSYNWHEVIHTFQSPMYYISYCTSALAAADIFAMSVDNRQAAIDLYMNISAYPTSTMIRELCEDTGLPDLFEEGTIEDISIAVDHYVDRMDEERDRDNVVKIVLIVTGVIGLLFLLVLFVVLIRLNIVKGYKR